MKSKNTIRQHPYERTIIIGDVHGCADELERLLKKAEYRPSTDRLIFIGDLVNKGPDSHTVYQIYKETRALSVLGNHEQSLMHHAQGHTDRNHHFQKRSEEFGNDFESFLAELPLWPKCIRMPGYLIVHAGFDPHHLPESQSAHTLCTIRTLPENRNFRSPNHPWFKDYKETGTTVIFGHWAALNGHRSKTVIGLDTGCVYGGKLTALILPERRFITVKAKKAYTDI